MRLTPLGAAGKKLIMSPSRIPTRTLRAHPDRTQLKRQAKELLAAFRRGDDDADAGTFSLAQAQLVLARAHATQDRGCSKP